MQRPVPVEIQAASDGRPLGRRRYGRPTALSRFKHAYRTEFPGIDGFVRRRLRAILRRHAHQADVTVTPAKTTGAGRMPSSPSTGFSP
jgi:hypothetical protein